MRRLIDIFVFIYIVAVENIDRQSFTPWNPIYPLKVFILEKLSHLFKYMRYWNCQCFISVSKNKHQL